VATIGVLVWWFVADNRNEAQELQAAQDELETYTNSLETVMGSLTPVATQLSTAGELDDAALAKRSKEWRNRLAAAQTSVAQVTPPEDLQALSGLLTQGVLLYVQSADQYALLPRLDAEVRSEVAAKAAGSFQAASGIFAGAIELLDRERQENDMGASRLTTPGTPAESIMPGEEGVVPSEEIEIPAEEGSKDQGTNKQGAKKQGAKKGDG